MTTANFELDDPRVLYQPFVALLLVAITHIAAHLVYGLVVGAGISIWNVGL